MYCIFLKDLRQTNANNALTNLVPYIIYSVNSPDMNSIPPDGLYS